MIVIANLLRNLHAVKDLVNLLFKKNTVPEHPLTVNMLKDPKHLQNLDESTFTIFFITLTEVDLKNIFLSDMLNLRGVS